MDVIARLRGWALARPRVLLVDTPGTTTLRWAIEADLDHRGWSRALAPADTDLLVVLGAPGLELASAVEVLWSQVPEPRHRVNLHRASDMGAALDEGRAALVRRAQCGSGGDDRSSPASLLGQDRDVDHEGMDPGGGHEGMGHGGGHEGMDPGGGHEGMDHGGEVAGLPMASTGPDRDGLELDVLEVALGPVLHGWPTGLVMRAELQGDVVTAAELSWLDAGTSPAGESPPDFQLGALDRLARFLDVVGWPKAARDARRARDGLIAGGPERGRGQRLAVAVARRVGRSRALSWTAGDIGKHGSGGGVLDRVRRWCDSASGEPVEKSPVMSLEDVAAMVQGMEIGSARLIVASLELAPASAVSTPEHLHA